MKLPPQLLPLSSKVDWCEENYQMLSFIAEFWNTTRDSFNHTIDNSTHYILLKLIKSNIIFLIIPPIMMINFKQYGEVMDMPVNIVWE